MDGSPLLPRPPSTIAGSRLGLPMSTVGAAPGGPGSRPGEASTAVAPIRVPASPLVAASSTCPVSRCHHMCSVVSWALEMSLRRIARRSGIRRTRSQVQRKTEGGTNLGTGTQLLVMKGSAGIPHVPAKPHPGAFWDLQEVTYVPGGCRAPPRDRAQD